MLFSWAKQCLFPPRSVKFLSSSLFSFLSHRCLHSVLMCKRKCGNPEVLKNCLRKLKRTISEAATRFSGYHQHVRIYSIYLIHCAVTGSSPFCLGEVKQHNYLYLELVVQRITSTSAKGNIQHFIQMFVDPALGLVNYDVCNWK